MSGAKRASAHEPPHQRAARVAAIVGAALLVSATGVAAQLPDVGASGPWTVEEDTTVGPETRLVDGNLTVRAGATLTLEGTEVRFTSGHGVLIETGGRLIMTDGGGRGVSIGPQTPGASFAFRVEGRLDGQAPGPHVIEGVSAGEEHMGAIILAPGGAVADLAATTVRSNTDAGIVVGPGSSLSASGLTLSNVGRTGVLAPATSHVSIAGLTAQDMPVPVHVRGGTDVTLTDCDLSGSTAGILAEAGATVTVAGCTLGGRIGVLAQEASTLIARSTTFSGYAEAGAVLLDGSHLDLDGSMVDGGGAGLFGILADDAGRIDIATTTVRSHAATYAGTGSGVQVTGAEDLVVTGSQLDANAAWGLIVVDAPYRIDATGTGNAHGLWRASWNLELALQFEDGTPATDTPVSVTLDGTEVATGTTGPDGKVGPWLMHAEKATGDGVEAVTYVLHWSHGQALVQPDGPGPLTIELSDASTQAAADAASSANGTGNPTNGSADDGNSTQGAAADGTTSNSSGDGDGTGTDATNGSSDADQGPNAGVDDGGGATSDAASADTNQGTADEDASDGDSGASEGNVGDPVQDGPNGSAGGPMEGTPGVSIAMVVSTLAIVTWMVRDRRPHR